MKKVFLSFAALFFILIVAGLFLPKNYTLTSERSFKAPISKIHKVIGDLRTWSNWNPWMKDETKVQFSVDSFEGVGATQKWKGPDGEGYVIFSHVDPKAGVAYDIQFENLPKATGRFDYLEGGDNQSKVTWLLSGTIPFPIIGGYICLLMKFNLSKSMDEGLGNIAELVENSSP